MSGQKRTKGTSVAAFLFLPQFHLSTQHLSHLMPVFMRTLALMFTQAGLLPRNHPALMYGIQGVKKIGFAQMMGEAWFTLRTTKATPYQWGLFSSVVLMLALTIASIASFFMTVIMGFGESARAQIFDHPNGATDAASMPGVGPGMFNRDVPPVNNAHGDFGIMILDKMMRYGMEGTGSPLQNATQALFQIYNSGILIIAGIMLFWSILSVVVDTAKTGQVGGGRHNMVWAPIRIVFALGLLIPLGATGFSSGQFMVMKLAEWGSNFGTRAWLAYVNGVVNESTMISNAHIENPTGIVTQFIGMHVCTVAYNGYAYQAGALNADQQVTWQQRTGVFDFGKRSYSFTNNLSSNMCGQVTFDTQNGAASLIGTTMGIGSSDAMIAARNQIVADYYTNFMAMNAGAREIACGIVAEHIHDSAPGDANSPLILDGDCGAVGGEFDGSLPAPTTLATLVDQFYTATTASMAAGVTTLRTYTTSANFMTEISGRGWAGMGMWYHRIAEMNDTIQKMEAPSIAITPGDFASSGVDSDHLAKIQEAMTAYDRWWKNFPSSYAAGPATPAPDYGGVKTAATATPSNKVQTSKGSTDVKSLATGLSTMSNKSAGKAVMDVVMDDTDFFLFDLVQKDDVNVYPLAELAATGNQIMASGMAILVAATILPGLISIIPDFGIGIVIELGNLGLSLSSSPLFQELIGTAAMSMLMAGALLSFYVPIIPFVRTAFSVLTWMISVFEAIVMVPIAALAHITTVGDGLAAGGKQAWIAWLNVLLRPTLTVLGFVAAMMTFNTFVVYFHESFTRAIVAGLDNPGIVDQAVYTIVYVGCIYTAANTTFKLLDLMPSAMMKYLGGSADTSFDDSSAEGFISAAGQRAVQSGTGLGGRNAARSRGFLDARTGKTTANTPGGTPSDRNLKENIERVGEENGFNIYEFSYKGKPGRFRGVMAQEVQHVRPDAVVKMDGFLAVRYDMIGIEFKELT